LAGRRWGDRSLRAFGDGYYAAFVQGHGIFVIFFIREYDSKRQYDQEGD
jgi:hypothetical protein